MGFRNASDTVSTQAPLTLSVCHKSLWKKEISKGEKFLLQTSAPCSCGALWCCSLGKGFVLWKLGMREALPLGTAFCRVLQGSVCHNELAVVMALCSLELLLI